MNVGWTELLLLGLWAVFFLIPYIFFLISQQNTLRSIKPENRKMQPGEVWLQLIPLFNIIWQFFVVARIADSIRNEINDRNSNSLLGISDPVFLNDLQKRPTYDIGLAFCILSLCALIPIFLFGSMAGFACLTCWIIYWIQIVGFKNKFQNNPL